jgi:hypothetical protein
VITRSTATIAISQSHKIQPRPSYLPRLLAHQSMVGQHRAIVTLTANLSLADIRCRMSSFKDDLAHFWYTHPGLLDTIKLLSFPFLCPFSMYHDQTDGWFTPRHIRKRNKIDSGLSGIAQRRRERALQRRQRSPSMEGSRDGGVFAQPQSPLFAILPAEIRLCIYQMVLCSPGTIHIRRVADRANSFALMSTTCSEPNAFGHKHQDCVEYGPTRSKVQVSLAFTCRRMYVKPDSPAYSPDVY